MLPALAVAVNLLTIAMSYGMLVLLFQGTAFEKILRFTSTGGIDAVVPVVLLCILFGITMDYAVFMLTRTHERWNRTHDNRESIITGITRTGRIIASAALLVVVVTGAFAFTNISQTKMMGLGIALAIIADAILIRVTLLPAIMAYLGRANWWWPGFEWVKGWAGSRMQRPDRAAALKTLIGRAPSAKPPPPDRTRRGSAYRAGEAADSAVASWRLRNDSFSSFAEMSMCSTKHPRGTLRVLGTKLRKERTPARTPLPTTSWRPSGREPRIRMRICRSRMTVSSVSSP